MITDTSSQNCIKEGKYFKLQEKRFKGILLYGAHPHDGNMAVCSMPRPGLLFPGPSRGQSYSQLLRVLPQHTALQHGEVLGPEDWGNEEGTMEETSLPQPESA